MSLHSGKDDVLTAATCCIYSRSARLGDSIHFQTHHFRKTDVLEKAVYLVCEVKLRLDKTCYLGKHFQEEKENKND